MHVITHLAMGGAENVAIGLCERLRDAADFTVFAVIGGPLSPVGAEMAERLERAGVEVLTGTPGRFKSGGVVLAALRLAAAVRRERPDVIHLHTEIPELTAAVAGVFSKSVRSAATLRTVHNSTLWIDWARIGAWVTGRLHRARAVAVSEAAAQADAQIATRRKRPLADVVYNGVVAPHAPDPDASAPSPATDPGPEACARPLRVLFAGRLVEQKGADLLPAILHTARSLVMRDDVEITVAGEGPLGDGLIDRLAASAPRWTVAMTPPISGLAQKLAGYDALLMPSRFEGFALLPLEAMLAGIPIIISRAPGIDEALPAGYPFAAATGDAQAMGALLAQVLNEPQATRRSVQRFSSEIGARFSVERMTERYMVLYHGMAGGSCKP